MALAEAVGLANRELVAFVGAGGKKTAMARLVREGTDRGLDAGYTTTTHIPPPDIPLAVAEPEVIEVALADRDPPVAFARDWVEAPERADRKLKGFDPAVVDWIYRTRRFDWLLVKADGARRRGFKAPGPGEPVLPEATTLVVPVTSVQVVGEPLEEPYVHRPQRVAGITGMSVGEPLSPAAVGTVLASPAGGLKGIPTDAAVTFLVNQADTDDLAATGRDVLGHAFAGVDRPVRGVVSSFRTDRYEVVEPD